MNVLRSLGSGACCVLALAGWIPGARAAERTPRVHALVGARVVVEPGKVLDGATVVLRDGIVVAVGKNVPPPADARRWDFHGRTIYPGLIEAYLDWTPERPAAPGADPGAAAPGGTRRRGESPSAPAPERRGPAHENARVHPESDVVETLAFKSEMLDELHALGFTVAHVVPAAGIFRGHSALVSLCDAPPDRQVLRLRVAQVVALERGGDEDGGGRRPPTYPGSLMGSVALVRQTLLDAGWARQAAAVYAAAGAGLERPASNLSLQALWPVLSVPGARQPVWMETGDALGFLRVAALAREFGLNAVLVGSGEEYRQLDAVRAAGSPLVLPVAFPAAPRFESDDEALDVDLEVLRHWQAAPDNPRLLNAAGVRFALTSHGLKKRQDFSARLQSAVEHGLPPDAALAALTTVPARLLGVERQLGSIEPGKIADLTVTDGDLFAADTHVLEVWVDGDRYEVTDRKRDALERVRGDWNLAVRSGNAAPEAWTLKVQGAEAWTLEAALQGPGGSISVGDLRWSQGELAGKAGSGGGMLRLHPAGKSLRGMWVQADGRELDVEGKRSESRKGDRHGEAAAEASTAPEATPAVEAKPWPPAPEAAPPAVLVRGATIWTEGSQGRLETADLLAAGGKIVAVGKDLRPPAGVLVVEAQGKHVTPGLIDCHSHSNILGGVNEATHSCTAEVRIADVLNSESIAIYRELAGGLTVADELHGSANAIGGQNAVMKLRWGSPPAALVFDAAPPGIKFALGENPKQSNWGEANTRYPQTRLGVEQVIRESFMAARDYMRAWDEYGKRTDKNKVLPPRRDLQLEALAEVLRGERLVHAHSYRQDEILMLLRVAEEFGFRVATFQHVLEGYKVADEMAAHGAGASAFSDWWAFKFEVYDAIPYNGPIMHDRGVVVSYNSDSAELARRLNLEAAKAVQYGGLPPEEALRFVTANPARQLRIDKRVGTLEPGKDADFVIWSGDPLSTYTRCEQTWIDGRRYFDRSRDLAARAAMEAERQALLEKARAARRGRGAETEEGGDAWKPGYLDDGVGGSCHAEKEARP